MRHSRTFFRRYFAILALPSVLALGLTAGCSDDEPDVDPLYREVQDIFAASCGGGGCHLSGGVPAGGLSLAPGDECDAMIDVKSLEVPDLDLVVSGDPARSYLICKMVADCADLPAGAALMPPGGAPLVPADEIAAIEQWITAGLPGCSESSP